MVGERGSDGDTPGTIECVGLFVASVMPASVFTVIQLARMNGLLRFVLIQR